MKKKGEKQLKSADLFFSDAKMVELSTSAQVRQDIRVPAKSAATSSNQSKRG